MASQSLHTTSKLLVYRRTMQIDLHKGLQRIMLVAYGHMLH